MLAIKHINKFFPDYTILVIVPSVYLKSQWEEKIVENNLKNVSVKTVQSRPEGKYELLILDEIHRYVEVEFSKVFDSIDYQFLLGLTATLDKQDKRMDIIRSRCPVFDTVSTKEALENKWISDFQIYCLGINADDSSQEELEKLDNKMKRFFSTFNYDFDLVNKCIKDPVIRKSFAKNKLWDEKIVMAHAIQTMKAIRERKNILYNHPSKIDTIVKLVNRFPDKKIIVFSENTQFADKIHERIFNSGIYHSNLPSVLIHKETGEVVGYSVKDGSQTMYSYNNRLYASNKLPKEVKRVSAKTYSKQTIEDFVNGKINVLVTAKAFDEGVDIPNIDMTITAAGSGKARQSIQRRGRGLRKTGDKISLNVELYIMNSQEEKWLVSRLKHIPNVKYIVDIEEIG